MKCEPNVYSSRYLLIFGAENGSPSVGISAEFIDSFAFYNNYDSRFIRCFTFTRDGVLAFSGSVLNDYKQSEKNKKHMDRKLVGVLSTRIGPRGVEYLISIETPNGTANHCICDRDHIDDFRKVLEIQDFFQFQVCKKHG